ncbi:MAG TPA: hypothetical protein VNQ73_22960 [Ilumatobacter sp.]|nr:hypothetical protein [Ilumatobacter sp.]
MAAMAAAAHAWDTARPAQVGVLATRLDMPAPALLTSDSAWLAIKSYGAIDAVQGFDHLLALASCRRRVSTSCRNYDGSVPPSSYQVVGNHGDAFEVLIQAAGYDDSDRDFVSDVDRTIWRTRELGYRRVVWVTLRENVSYLDATGRGYAAAYQRNNEALRVLHNSGQYPELIIADWANYARDRPEWFSADGIHMNRRGAYASADYISRKMAFLDRRACPNPPAPGQAVQNPCPDPDATGPVNDIEGLYPTTEFGPHSGLALVWEGRGSWPNPPWWAP